jgi:competence protein ComFC
MFGAKAMSALYDVGLALTYPQACAVCGGSVESRFDGVVCASCWEETRVFTARDTLCWKCGVLSLASIAEEKREEVRCRRCDDADFTAARACGLYQGALRAAIIELKRAPHVPKRLAQLMFETSQRLPLDRFTLIVPVPLHPQREKQRGFNQATLLAHELSRLARRPVVEDCLIRVAQTERHRAGMDQRARRESVEDAFAVLSPRTIADEHILLIDDVFTTGSTVSACARALLDAGANEVLVLTIARPSDSR